MSDLEIAAIRQELADLKELVRQVRSLVGPFGVPMPDGSVLTQSIHGMIYFRDPADAVMAPQTLIYRQWEAELSALVLSLCSNATSFVDVGANLGYFTCLAANRLARNEKRDSEVLAIEPHPKLAGLLRRNIEINWSSAPVKVFEAAASDTVGEVTLYVPQEHGANANLSPSTGGAEIKVEAVRLDDIVNKEIDVLKIDVEGHEVAVIRGAIELIKTSKDLKVIVEWSPHQMTTAGVEPQEMMEVLAPLGFVPYQARASLGEPLGWGELLELNYDNILFQRP